MVYAPVIIPTLCRYEHFVRCIESLRKNPWAKYTDVYIGLDYPPNESYKEGYSSIKEYLKNDLSEFKKITVFERARNYGALKNILSLIDYVSMHYDRYICMEDDIECSPVFLEYMDTMLEKYKNDKSVIAVSGYAAPINLVYSEGATALKQQLQANTWGIGFWTKRREAIQNYLNNKNLAKRFVDVYKTGNIYNMTDWAIWDYLRMMSGGGSLNAGIKNQTDVVMRILLTVEDKYVIMPTKSKTRNLGFDGSGLYCPDVEFDSNNAITSSNYDYSHQAIDENVSFIASVDEDFDNDLNRAIYNQYDIVNAEELNRLMDFAEMYCNHNSAWRKAYDIRSKFVGNLNRVKNYISRKVK